MSKDTFYGIIIVALAGLLLLSVFTQGFGLIKVPASVPTQVTPIPSQPTPSQPTPVVAPTPGKLTVTLGDYAPLGKDSAPVAWVEFSDFQCPFCAKIYSEAAAQVKTNYIDSGKVKLYYRDFPLSFHPNAMPGAIAARCANDQGKFWEMHDKLFSNQDLWSGAADPGITFKGYATDLGLDATKFASCYDNKEHLAQINADEAQGQSYGVSGTPSNFLIIKKSNAKQADIESAISSVNTQYNGDLQLFVNDDSYIVLIPGAYPYLAFDAVLSKVTY